VVCTGVLCVSSAGGGGGGGVPDVVVVVVVVVGVASLGDVVKVWSSPTVDPAALVATTRKWYVVFGVRPTRSVATGTTLVPEPASASTAGDRDPYDVDAPYSNRYVVDDPFGSTEPPSVALVSSTADAEPVVALGFTGVVKAWSSPTVVPATLVATSRKWYVVPGERPPRFADAATALVPAPAPVFAVVAP